MGVTAARPMSLAEFLAWEERQELRHEFDGCAPVAMTGGTIAHGRIQRNLTIAVGSRLGRPCEFLGSDTKLLIEQRVRYPDGLVVCSPRGDGETFVTDPVVIFEILSPSTSGVDRIVKNLEYKSLESVQRYVMLEQDRVAATVLERHAMDWVADIVGPEGWLLMPEIGVKLPLIELYRGLDITVEHEKSRPE